MKRTIGIILALVIIAATLTTSMAECNNCNCGCPNCCNTAKVSSEKCNVNGYVFSDSTIQLILSKKLWIVGVKSPDESGNDFGGFLGLQKERNDLSSPEEILGSGKCKRTKAWASISKDALTSMESLYVGGMSTFTGVTLAIRPEFTDQVRIAVYEWFEEHTKIKNVEINAQTIILATLHFYADSCSNAIASHRFFASGIRSDIVGYVMFSNGNWLSIRIGDFDGSGKLVLGFEPGLTPKPNTVPDPIPEPEPEPAPKPQSNNKNQQKKNCTKDPTVVVNVVINNVIGLINKVATVIQNQVNTGCNNQQNVTVPGCK